jgi:hypothetical protein
MHDPVRYILVIVWFISYMASIYLALHIVVARMSRAPDSRLAWFFSVVTAPLTRPVRALLPPATPETRVRMVALGVFVAIWLLTKLAIAALGGNPIG